MTKYTTKQDIARQDIIEQSRIEVTESGARGDTEMIPVVPILCKKVHLRLEECGRYESQTNATKASLRSPVSNATKA